LPSGWLYIFAIMMLESSDEEGVALAKHLRQAIEEARYPLAPRLDPLKAILAKLDSPKPKPEIAATVKSRRGAKPRPRPAGEPETHSSGSPSFS
jgi:hypothetical protein